MTNSAPPGWIFNETVKMFATPSNPPVEDKGELETYLGRAWGGKDIDQRHFADEVFAR